MYVTDVSVTVQIEVVVLENETARTDDAVAIVARSSGASPNVCVPILATEKEIVCSLAVTKLASTGVAVANFELPV
jgi:hypothetical protein